MQGLSRDPLWPWQFCMATPVLTYVVYLRLVPLMAKRDTVHLSGCFRQQPLVLLFVSAMVVRAGCGGRILALR